MNSSVAIPSELHLQTQHSDQAHDLRSKVMQAVDCVSRHRIFQPQVAIILGSGLGGLAEDVQHPSHVPYEEIPHFQATHAAGHRGRLVLGYLAGMPVVIMQGRYHRYEGHCHADVCFPVRVMRALGATTLLVTNAAGGLNPRYRPGDLMIVDQHIDCLWPRGQNARMHGARGPGQIRGDKGHYDEGLMDTARRIALKHGWQFQKGTYVSTLGPTYETRAEYRMFRWMGGDAVGMSTIPEVLTAWELDMRVLAISVITNVACTDSQTGTSHEEVVACGKQVEPRLRHLFSSMLQEMSGPAD